MAFKELRGLEKELYLKTKIEELTRLYRRTQKDLSRHLREIDITVFQRYRTEAILKQVNEGIKVLNGGCYKWAKKTIPYGYERGIDMAAERLKALNVTRFVKYDAKIHSSAASVLIDDVTIDLITANQSMKNGVHRYIRMTQQRILEDKEISRLIAEGVIKGEARRTVSDEMLSQLRRQMGNEQFINIKGRNYRPDKYSELVARTRAREATAQGSINTALHYGVDLCQIDVHAGACGYCQQFMGRIYSISGSHTDFPMLLERPPFHPNCECNILPITRESIEERGYYDSMVKLSNSPMTKIDSFSRFEELVGAL